MIGHDWCSISLGRIVNLNPNSYLNTYAIHITYQDWIISPISTTLKGEYVNELILQLWWFFKMGQ